MPILNSILSWLMVKRLNEIDLFRKYPIDVQNEVLFKLIKKAKDTEWGKKHNFNSIRSKQQFNERVPVSDYETIKPYIIRLRHGEENLLWPDEIKWFAKSSGTTTDKSKFIPVSKDALENCHFRGGKDIIAIYHDNYPENKIIKGKGLTIGGSRKINNFSNDSYYGDLSAVLIQNLPFWAEFLRTPNQSISLMDEWDEKIEKIARATIDVNVTSISGVPSWTLVLIKHILQITGKSNLIEVWPELEVFLHGGVSFTPYREEYKKLIPSSEMHYMETYNASEGFFGIQDDPTKDDMLLMLDYGVYYEFVNINEIHDDNPKIVDLEGVEVGENYAMLITTNGGLWRYKIGDTVTFTSKIPFKIKITGRIKHFINAFGEELIIDNAEKAIKIACEKTNASVKEYTAGPVYPEGDKTGKHQWLFEFNTPPADLDYFIETMDNALKSVNSDYEAKRFKNMTLDKPDVRILKPGTFYEWLKNKGKLGGQNKVPRLANNRKYLDELLGINM